VTQLLLEIAWKSAVTSGVALLILAVLQNRTAAERSWAAHLGLLATLALPIVILLLPNWNVRAPTILPSVILEAATAPSAAGNTPPRASPTRDAIVQDSAAVETGFDVETLVLWGYGVPAAILVLMTLLAVLRLFALRRRASVIVEPAWLSALALAQQRMGFKHGTALLVSKELTSPVSWGILRPIILLNEEAVASRSDAEAVIAHELAHIAGLDWAKLLVARLATCLFWFNPLVWQLARHCHQLREEAADDAVLLSDVSDTDYAALLVGAARHENKAMLLAANGVAPGRDSLQRRVKRVLDVRLSRAPAPLAWTSACCAGAVLIVAPLSALTPVTPLPTAMTDHPSLSSANGGVVAPQMAQPRHQATAQNQAVEAAAGAFGPATPSQPSEPQAIAPTLGLQGKPSPQIAPARPNDVLPPEMLIKMRVHGVTPEYARDLAAISPAYANFVPEELVALRVQGVSASFVRELAELGYRSLSHRDLMSMAIQGVTPAFIKELGALGYRGLSAEQLVTMRIQDVSPEFVSEFRRAGYQKLTAQELIDLRVQGVRLSSQTSSGETRGVPR
jgi:beta-lactamase regulating signal transducer with metallopeptidase domain